MQPCPASPTPPRKNPLKQTQLQTTPPHHDPQMQSSQPILSPLDLLHYPRPAATPHKKKRMNSRATLLFHKNTAAPPFPPQKKGLEPLASPPESGIHPRRHLPAQEKGH